MNYLKTTSILSSLAGSVISNYATRGVLEKKPLLFNFFVDTRNINGLRSSHHDQEAYGLPSLRFNINDAIAMGIGTVTPLLISALLKTSPKDLDSFHFGIGFLTSSIMTAYLEYNDKGLKK